MAHFKRSRVTVQGDRVASPALSAGRAAACALTDHASRAPAQRFRTSRPRYNGMAITSCAHRSSFVFPHPVWVRQLVLFAMRGSSSGHCHLNRGGKTRNFAINRFVPFALARGPISYAALAARSKESTNKSAIMKTAAIEEAKARW